MENKNSSIQEFKYANYQLPATLPAASSWQVYVADRVADMAIFVGNPMSTQVLLDGLVIRTLVTHTRTCIRRTLLP